MSGQLEFGDEDRSVALPRVWELCLHLLATKVSKVTFSSYIETACPLSYVGNTITLGVTSPFAREWLEKKAANAIRSAGREDPNVILIGELRTNETMKLALQLASFGILVFATVHTNSAPATIDRWRCSSSCRWRRLKACSR